MIAPCINEFDISIIDRLSPILNGSPFIASKISDEKTGQRNSTKNGFGFTLETPQLDVRLRYNLNEFILLFSPTSSHLHFNIVCRFPCTDLRPIHTPDRVPWWKRNVLRDSLYIQLSRVKLLFQPNKYDVVADEIDVYYSVISNSFSEFKLVHILISIIKFI